MLAIKTLRNIVTWLEKRFPEKIVVTVEQLKKNEERLAAIEKDVAALKVAYGFGAQTGLDISKVFTR